MIKSKILNLLILFIGLIFLMFAVLYVKEKNNFAIVHLLLGFWCISGSIRNFLSRRPDLPSTEKTGSHKLVKANILLISVSLPLLIFWSFFLERYMHLWFVRVPGILIGITCGISLLSAFIVALIAKAKEA
jgi:hypothetical protein